MRPMHQVMHHMFRDVVLKHLVYLSQQELNMTSINDSDASHQYHLVSVPGGQQSPEETLSSSGELLHTDLEAT